MTRPRQEQRRILRTGDERAVSNVLGAILIFGLLVLTLVMIQVRFVPVWDRDKEAAHMQLVGNQLGQIKSDLDRLADNRTQVPLSDPLNLKASSGGFRFFSSHRLPSTLELAPAGAGQGLRLSTSQANVLSLNGQQVFAGSESWTQVVAGNTLDSVGTVQNLRLRITNPASWSTGDSVNLVVTNATGAYAGKIVVTNFDHGDSYSLRFETFARSSPTIPVTITEDTFDKKSPPTYQYVDLLRQDLQFRQVLALSTAPLTVTLNRNNLNVDYTAAYTVVNAGGGSTQVGGGGVLIPGFSRSLSSGILRIQSNNQHFIDQTYTVEHGAVILSQPDGASMYIPPTFEARLIAGVTDLRWVLPAIQGSGMTLSGPATATLAMTPGTPQSFLATMPRLDVTLTTAHGAVWAQYWSNVLQAAGLQFGTQFTVASNTTSATLTILGIQAQPSSTVDDVVVTFLASQLTITPRAGA